MLDIRSGRFRVVDRLSIKRTSRRGREVDFVSSHQRDEVLEHTQNDTPSTKGGLMLLLNWCRNATFRENIDKACEPKVRIMVALNAPFRGEQVL
jgi:hypothetical protein